MGDITRFHVVCLGVGLLGAVFIGVGMFGKGWIVLSRDISRDEKHNQQTFSFGIWNMEMCSKNSKVPKPFCVTLSIDHIVAAMEHIKKIQVFFNEIGFLRSSHYLPLQILMTVGSLSVVAGLVLLSVYLFCVKKDLSYKFRHMCVVSGVCFGLSGTLVLVANALDIKENIDSEDQIAMPESMNLDSTSLDMELNFPWAILVSGLGALVDIVLGIVLLLHVRHVNRATQDGEAFMSMAYKNDV